MQPGSNKGDPGFKPIFSGQPTEQKGLYTEEDKENLKKMLSKSYSESGLLEVAITDDEIKNFFNESKAVDFTMEFSNPSHLQTAYANTGMIPVGRIKDWEKFIRACYRTYHVGLYRIESDPDKKHFQSCLRTLEKIAAIKVPGLTVENILKGMAEPSRAAQAQKPKQPGI